MVPWTPVQKPWIKQNQQPWQLNNSAQNQRPAWAGGGGVTVPSAKAPAAWPGAGAAKGGSKGKQPWLPGGGGKSQPWGGGGKGMPWGGGGKGMPWGGGKGMPWGGGKGGGKQWPQPWAGGGFVARKPPPSVPQNYEVDDHARYMGVVDFYQKWKGYGFIISHDKGIVPNDRIFVHWREVQSDDRYPFLTKGMEVEFSVNKTKDLRNWQKDVWTLKAGNVTMGGGLNISVQDDNDATEKEFVGGQHLRYTGQLKFFNTARGYGYVKMDEGYDVDSSVPQELRVVTAEVNAGGRQPVKMEGIAVEFGIWKTKKGKYEVYNMTLPGGHPLTQDALENRISMGPQAFMGEVTTWSWKGWGFIKCDPNMSLPARVLTKLQAQVDAARGRGKNISEDKLLYFRKVDCAFGFQPQRGQPVSFQLYVDDKGAGACEITHG